MLGKLLKSKKGMAIEWAIVFGLIIFAFSLILITLIGSSHTVAMQQKQTVSQQVEISQVGEYFLRACQLSGDFPTGQEDNYDKFTWMDDSAKEFFTKIKEQYGYTFRTSVIDTSGTFWNFYADDSLIRKLNVMDNDRIVLTIAVAEEYVYDEKSFIFTTSKNPQSKFSVVEWIVGDDLSEYESDDLNVLQKVWKWAGKLFNATETPGSSTYTVIYKLNDKDVNGNSLRKNPTCDTTTQGFVGNALTLPRPTCQGYKFDGWYDAKEDGNKITEVTKDNFEGVKEGSTVTYYAHWSPCIITLEDGTQKVTKYATTSLPEPLTKRNGYYFAGWSDGTTTYPQGTQYVAKKDITLTAVWLDQADLVVIEYHYNGADSEFVTGNEVLDPGTTEITLPVAHKTGYSFVGWVDTTNQNKMYSDDLTYKVEITSGTIVLEAKYEVIHYEIKYMVDGKYSNNFSPSYYTIEDEFEIPSVPKPVNDVAYNPWSGPFSDNINENWEASDMSGTVKGKYGDITLSTTTSKFTIYLKYNDVTTYTYTGFVVLPKLTREGYKFGGWTDGTTEYPVGTRYLATEDTTLTAIWDPYKVTYDSNYGETDPTIKYGPKTVPTINRKGYNFLGWYTDKVGGEKITVTSDNIYIPTGNVTLYAHWELIYYKVDFNFTENKNTTKSSNVSIDSINLVPYGTTISISEDKKTLTLTCPEGYKFSNGKTYITVEAYPGSYSLLGLGAVEHEYTISNWKNAPSVISQDTTITVEFVG